MEVAEGTQGPTAETYQIHLPMVLGCWVEAPLEETSVNCCPQLSQALPESRKSPLGFPGCAALGK